MDINIGTILTFKKPSNHIAIVLEEYDYDKDTAEFYVKVINKDSIGSKLYKPSLRWYTRKYVEKHFNKVEGKERVNIMLSFKVSEMFVRQKYVNI